MSPSTNFLFPGSTMSRVPPSRRKRGSFIPSSGMLTSPPSRTSRMSRPSEDFLTAPRTSALARRKNRWRFSRLLPPGFRRLSTMYIPTVASASASLLHPHVPLDEPPHLTLGIAAPHHPLDELAVLLFGVAVLFRTERDHRKQIFDLREDALLDDLADLLIAGPGRIFAAVLGPRPQGELDDLVAEVLWAGDACGLFDLGQLLVEKLAIEQLASVGVLEVLIFDPGIGIIDVAIEQVLAVIRIRFEIGFLDFVADEFRITRHQLGLDEFEVTLFDFVGKLLTADRLLKRIHQMDGVCAKLGGVVIVGCGENLECEARRDAVHAFVDAGGILVFQNAASLGIGFLQAFPVIDPHFRKQRRVFVLAQPRHHREARQRLQGCRRTWRGGELRSLDELLIDLLLLLHPQAVGHLDDADAIDEGFVFFVGLEALPFGFVRMRENDTGEWNGPDILGTDVVAFLGRR